MMTRDRIATLALLLTNLGCGAFAYAVGQDSNWDLRTYHWYNPYAFLHGRLAIDLGAAGIAGFYNPLLDVPTFLAGRALPAPVMGVLLGLIHGLNVWLLYGIAQVALIRVLPNWSTVTRNAAAAVLAIAGMLGGGNLALVGTSFNDNLVSLAVLGAALIILRGAPAVFDDTIIRPAAVVRVVGAGAIVGLAVGLKLPTAPFAVGLCAAFAMTGGGLRRGLALAFAFGLGVTAGFIVTGAPWMWVLWNGYANPLFPYFNGFFHSPMAIADSHRDLRFLPATWQVRLGFPYLFSLHPTIVGEIPFRDFRIAAAYTALIVTAAFALAARRRGQRSGAITSPARYLIAAAGLSYVPWLFVFAIYRYIVPLEMLAPLVMALAIAAWPIPERMRVCAVAVVLIVVTVTVRPGDWGHMPWRPGSFAAVTPPIVDHPETTLALITGNDPVAWVIPAFPPQLAFLRIYGALNIADAPDNGFNARPRTRVASHRGDIFVLFPEKESDNAVASLAGYGLQPDLGDCRTIASNLGDYVRWCRVYPGPDANPPTVSRP